MQQQRPEQQQREEAEAAPPPPRRRPRKIRPLPKEVVDRIAAGEVVQRPVSVVKELIENSLDADGTQIDVQCHRGGLDSITVTDDGTGISPRDLPLACTRHATSKLVEVDDLKSMRTFGFRGEALASASMVGRVTVTSRVRPRGKGEDVGEDEESEDESSRKRSNCAFKMQYRDGAPDERSNPRSKPKPSAGREGTVVQVQDLFHNVPSRRRAMEGRRNEREEYDRTLGVVQRYAVHEAKNGVGFLCRGGGGGAKAKAGARGGFGGGGGNRTDLNTQSLASVKRIQERRRRARSSSGILQFSTEEERFEATKDVIGHVFGAAVARELLPLTAGEGDVEAVSVAALKAMVQGKDDGSSDANKGANESNQEGKVGEDGGNSNRSDDFNASLLEEMMTGEAANEDPEKSADSDGAKTSSKFAFAYRAAGLVTNASYSASKSSAAFLLFVNGRLVESASIRRAVESVYADTLPKGGRPFVYLSLEIPGPHVDVNVHPTKREVALLHEDRLCDAVRAAARGTIGGAATSRTFSVATGGRLLPKEEAGDAARERRQLRLSDDMSSKEVGGASKVSSKVGKENVANADVTSGSTRGRKSSSPEDVGSDGVAAEESDEQQQQPVQKTPKKRAGEDEPTSSSNKKPRDSSLVRTNRALPVGALEPFLVKKEAQGGEGERASKKVDNPYKKSSAIAKSAAVKHRPGCPLANNPTGAQVDMTLPGAFASAICRCQIERAESLPPAPDNVVVRTNNANMPRPKKITPTQCEYQSIDILREEISERNDQKLNETLRDSTYVGAVSRSRSLVQSGIDLIMVDHRALAREMFYQVALWRFGGTPTARLGGGGVDVREAIGRALQFEEDLNSPDSRGVVASARVSETNADLAGQATACLEGKAAMLEEYFSIRFERATARANEKRGGRPPGTSLRVTGLPVLLEGHSPRPHGLPLFLLRLATEVDWKEEGPCFRGVCAELASFYSEPPFASAGDSDGGGDDAREDRELVDEEAKRYVEHTLFPAISVLLVPPKTLSDDGSVIKLANLTSLYKVFERC